MNTTVYVVDTSYLLEIFHVPTHSSTASIEIIERKFANAINFNCRIFVPSPCLFELGNHIAKIKDHGIRRKLKEKFHRTIANALSDSTPFTILYLGDIDVEGRLLEICDCFVKQHANDDIGLTDTFTALEAKRLKKRHHGLGYKVHIWTKDHNLKAQEPDTEENPFLG